MTEDNVYYEEMLNLTERAIINEIGGLRDKFAMSALNGLLSSPKLKPSRNDDNSTFNERYCREAYALADDMIEARKK